MAAWYLSRSGPCALRGRISRPRDRIREIVVSEGPHLGLNEVLADAGGQAGQFAVRRQGDSPDPPMMIAQTARTGGSPRVLPAGKLAGVDHDSAQIAMGPDPGVCGERQSIEVLSAQGSMKRGRFPPASTVFQRVRNPGVRVRYPGGFPERHVD